MRDEHGQELQIQSDHVVLAAGAWSSEGIALDSREEAPTIRPVKGQIARLCGPALIRHVIRTPDVYLVPRKDGRLLIGATVEEMGYEDAPSAGAAMDLLRHGWELLPGIYDLDFQSVDVGFRPAAPDHLPCIGQGSLSGLWWATGHYRNGILMAPATADALTECILSGKMVASIEPFDPSRLHHSTESCG